VAPQVHASEQETPEALFLRYRERGDLCAFSQLYVAFGQTLFAVAVKSFRSRYGGDAAHAMAADAAQETWTRAVQCKDQWDPARGSFRAWLFAIHYHGLVEVLRRGSVERARSDVIRELPSPQAGAEARVAAREELEKLLQHLTADEAALLMAYVLVGKAALVAAAFGLTEVAVRKRIERLRERLVAEVPPAELSDAFWTSLEGKGRT
jgi:RNA polymerase sigma factor (sigma-70 family)